MDIKRLPWASWRVWKRIPAPSKRQVHLGIDYGTRTSKIVFRDYGAPGGESAVLVLRNGSFRIPSRVCVTSREILFGEDAKAAADCDIYESLKMRVAAEVSGNPKYKLGLTTKLPDEFRAADLAALTVWFLISEGHRAVAAYFNGRVEGVDTGMTLGVPMTFFDDEQLNAAFRTIACRAWSFYCNEGLLDSALLIEKARRVLEKHSTARAATADYEVQDLIRCEGDAAIWWLLNSPAVGTGPFAQVDVGAGTTQANLFRIFGKVHTVKRSQVPYGAAAVPVGMDAVGREVGKCDGLNSDGLAHRELGHSTLLANAKVRDALMPVLDQIYDSYRKAWNRTYSKLSGNPIELSAWRQHKVFVTGRGSRSPLLVDTFRIHPDHGEPLSVMTLEQPVDLIRADRRKITSEEFPFLTVAYGLSNM